MKKIILSSLVAASLAVPAVTLPFITTSCSDTTINITTNEKNKIVKDRDFSINFSLSNLSLHNVGVELIGESSGALSIVNGSIDTFLSSGTIYFHINESIHYNKEFFFSIQFTVQRGTKIETIVVDDFKIYYNPSHEQLVDLVKIDEKLISKSDSWIFEYKFQFSNMPLSNVVPSLINERTQLISIMDESIAVEKVGTTYICTVRIQLSHSIYESRIVPFNILLSFTNSYGLQQYEVINNMAVSFEGQVSNQVPTELLNITQEENDQGETKNVLHGFVQTVLPQTVTPYHILKIPENVDEIDQDAFANEDVCKNIQQIIFEGLTEKVGQHAFYGCIALKEFDVSIFKIVTGSTIPEWIDPIRTTHPTLLNTSHMIHTHSFFWVNRTWHTRTAEQLQKLCNDLGFPQQLSSTESGAHVVSTFDTFPDEFYNVVEINGEKVLKNINRSILDDYGQQLQIIRLPQGIKRIAPNALSPLANCPYIERTPRILILNDELTTIEGEYAFSYLGLDGPIIMPSGIKSIPSHTFEHASEYDDKFGYTLDSKLVIDFKACNELNSIGDNAFANNKNLVEVGGFPKSLGETGASFGATVFANCENLMYIDFSRINMWPISGWNDNPIGENVGGELVTTKTCFVPSDYINSWRDYLFDKGLKTWNFVGK